MSVPVQGLRIDFVTVNSSSWTEIPVTVDCDYPNIMNVDAQEVYVATVAAPTDWLIIPPNGQVPVSPTFPTRSTDRYLKGETFLYVKSLAVSAKIARLQTG